MAAVYRTLYEKYEQNDVLHVGIQEVVEAEKEIDTFLKSLDRDQRDQLDHHPLRRDAIAMFPAVPRHAADVDRRAGGFHRHIAAEPCQLLRT